MRQGKEAEGRREAGGRREVVRRERGTVTETSQTEDYSEVYTCICTIGM